MAVIGPFRKKNAAKSWTSICPKRIVLSVLVAFYLLLLCATLLADKVVLKEGQILTGRILLEKKSTLYLDIGITVLSIPRQEILDIQTEQAQTHDANQPVNEMVVPKTDSISREYLYRTTEMMETSLSQCVERVSPAVVMVSSPGGTGSGFFINEAGYLITNYHVIEHETRIEVTVFNKTRNGFEKIKFKKVKIEAFNPFVDLALLKVEDMPDEPVPYVCLGGIEDIKVGQRVFAVGNPLGLERTVTDGVVSTGNRAFEGLVYIQTNTDINPGNSGGPLFNMAGEVIGVTNMGYIFYGGLGFAIPVDYVRHFIDNRQAFAYDKDNPNSGYRYLQPPRRLDPNQPDFQGRAD